MSTEAAQETLRTALGAFLSECQVGRVPLPGPGDTLSRVRGLRMPRARADPIRVTVECGGERLELRVSVTEG
jgi:hypothetical protein